jgi:osmotically-inducible protein OsmY
MSEIPWAQTGFRVVRLGFVALIALALSACASGIAGAQSATDAALEARVAAAIDNASDLPNGTLSVDASDGIVRISGSVACENCGGMLTPGGVQTIQQSLGAVVRAVPGVERVEFDLEYRP